MGDFTEIDREDFRNLLDEISRSHMPFGKFGPQRHKPPAGNQSRPPAGNQSRPPSGVPIMDLPMDYLAWFHERGYPKGRLGELLAHVFEIKSVGMDAIFEPFRQARGGRSRLQPKRKRNFRFE